MPKTDEVIKNVKRIKPLSQTAMKLMDVLADPEHGIDDIRRIVETDSALTANILKYVNSSAFGLRIEISTVSGALPYVGDKMVMGIALGLAAGDMYGDALEGYDGERGVLWRHCLRTAIASREIAMYSKWSINAEIAYTGGILHDIGKAVISHFLEGSVKTLIDYNETGQVSDYIAGEMKELGTDHTEVGAMIAKHWRLPDPLFEIISHHHYPQEAKEAFRPLVYAVHLGDFVAMMAGSGTGADSMMYEIDETYKDFYDINDKILEEIYIRTEKEFERSVDVFQF